MANLPSTSMYPVFDEDLYSHGTGMPSYMSLPSGGSSGGGMGGVGGAAGAGLLFGGPIGAGIMGGGALLASLFGMRNQNKQRELDRQAQQAMATQNVASRESVMNPFRQQVDQAGAISNLDKLERGAYTPTKITPAGPYAKYMPQVSGGYSYTKSPELVSSAAALKNDVMAGNTAPTMTDPRNYGKTAALNLLTPRSNAVRPPVTRNRRMLEGDYVPSYGA